MKFLADMGVALRAVQWLREQGHDAIHLREENLLAVPK
jgi:predicted nuclease of predicted toxin-antitoxin system